MWAIVGEISLKLGVIKNLLNPVDTDTSWLGLTMMETIWTDDMTEGLQHNVVARKWMA
eukprot:CAMPEP_0172302930 /NCGR_PEP_ID=MMETSP1058-20130122/4569_1 /TAXON_ID=83371 /ORGANISM="Detonula confervacea, Strain CCMP 353" /LENGTH=57 /DNA_ID=CAMNT_0013013593 /DNA_START=293 /DNA_END=462 /DNA_ORIENTATION=-